ncbi:hypothetical protein DDB_G0271918 [Dictyostelium discoideum AX4]|uniref:Putative uncharacterized protein DDB_G0271918 n=1 Tax=Dictyostelium discoideum TaxID=44689 RepID=Y8558_DICDI|nr:hypothetical protein DDB_G0271918 [Dictyostelium discoideum AX4]Q86I92.1 RecName: Full=Putative uncharacterized protein DDB_G0271918 [Dictyostelium discoideum]EAL71483.1 hypothetical protein DDB_G0271918 [Dictyostelium discoideum AX4]|eukprot:XP_645411.1 hypothetical protein DDB_G0271918 [Dictyostelium discoideum AX4]
MTIIKSISIIADKSISKTNFIKINNENDSIVIMYTNNQKISKSRGQILDSHIVVNPLIDFNLIF